MVQTTEPLMLASEINPFLDKLPKLQTFLEQTSSECKSVENGDRILFPDWLNQQTEE